MKEARQVGILEDDCVWERDSMNDLYVPWLLKVWVSVPTPPPPRELNLHFNKMPRSCGHV